MNISLENCSGAWAGELRLSLVMLARLSDILVSSPALRRDSSSLSISISLKYILIEPYMYGGQIPSKVFELEV